MGHATQQGISWSQSIVFPQNSTSLSKDNGPACHHTVFSPVWERCCHEPSHNALSGANVTLQSTISPLEGPLETGQAPVVLAKT